MQTNTLTGAQELADFLEQCKILDIVDHGAGRMYVLEWDNQDVLAFADSSGNAFVVYPPASFDAESAGSVHDQCRLCTKYAGSIAEIDAFLGIAHPERAHARTHPDNARSIAEIDAFLGITHPERAA